MHDDVSDAEDGPCCDPTSNFKLQTSTGSEITDVSSLKTSLKNGNVVIRLRRNE